MDTPAQRIEEIRATAARFYAVDLHLHSPGSYDWDNSGTADEPRDADLDRHNAADSVSSDSVAAYRRDVIASGRDLVAITDHNVTGFAEAALADDESGSCFLPGIELAVAFSQAPIIRDLRIHVLAVLPESAHHEEFARILPSGTPPEASRDPSALLTYPSVQDLIDRIHREGGLAIAAHIESANGLRGVYKHTTELLLEPIGGTPEAQQVLRTLGDQVKDELVKFDAIQVTPTSDANHYTDPGGDLRVPLIVGTDCHTGGLLSQDQSAKYSFIKMARPSFAALRDALKFPDVRVRLKTGLPEARPPRLLGLRLVGHKSTPNTFFDETVLGFSDNLTCIIGPRGSGKSAAIDALRYLKGYNRTLDQIPKVAGQVTDRQKHTLEKTRIEAIYQGVDERVYRLVATYDSSENYVTEVYDLDGHRLNIEDVDACGEFPLNLFGWGELELLAGSPETQRELLDRFIPDVCELKDTKTELLAKLRENRRACLEQAQMMQEYFEDPALDFRRLLEYRAQFQELNTKEIEAVFARLDDIKEKRTVLKSIKDVLDARGEGGDMAAALSLSTYLEDPAIGEWAATFSARLKPDELDDWMSATSREHDRRINVAQDLVRAEDNGLERQQEVAEKEIQDVIGEDQAISGDLRNRAKSRNDNAAGNYADYKKLEEALDGLLDERTQLLNQVDGFDKQVFATRNLETERIRDEVSLVEDEQYRIGLVLEQKADRSSLVAHLTEGGLEFHGQWRAGKRAEILAAHFTPRGLADAILSGESEAMESLSLEVAGTEYTIKSADAKRLVDDNNAYADIEGLDAKRVDQAKLDALLGLQEIPMEDAFYITLGDKPIQYCSPGQRCSAMLPVVALTSQAPLVIDQPEDNLDNRLVSRALFKILARLKETRQVILATHNPNILVSGDAEQVLLLSSNGDLERHGCIDDPGIIDAVLGLMEGGTEAFQRRLRKYEPYL